jgi:hypothetical protein
MNLVELTTKRILLNTLSLFLVVLSFRSVPTYRAAGRGMDETSRGARGLAREDREEGTDGSSIDSMVGPSSEEREEGRRQLRRPHDRPLAREGRVERTDGNSIDRMIGPSSEEREEGRRQLRRPHDRPLAREGRVESTDGSSIDRMIGPSREERTQRQPSTAWPRARSRRPAPRLPKATSEAF